MKLYSESNNVYKYLQNVGISNVWDLRSSLCAETYTTFSCYDIWALLKKPTPTDPPISRMSNSFNESIITDTENRVKAANERRLKATAERDRLLLEPENGVEFLRLIIILLFFDCYCFSIYIYSFINVIYRCYKYNVSFS